MKRTSLVPGVLCLVLLTCAAAWSAPTVAGTTNLVAAENGGRIAKFSSQAVDENGQPLAVWSVTNLIDGKHVVGSHTPADSYGWRARGVPTPEAPEWVIFELPETRLISRVVIDPTTDDPEFLGRWVKNVRISVSTDSVDGPFKPVGSYVVVRRAIKQSFDFPPAEARWIKLDITANWGSDLTVEMGEFEVYEAIVGGDTLDQLIQQLSNLLDDLKRYRDSQRYQEHQATTEAVTAPPAVPVPPVPAPEGGGEQ